MVVSLPTPNELTNSQFADLNPELAELTSSLAARVRPTSAPRDRLLAVAPELASLFPAGAIQRGAIVEVELGDGPLNAIRARRSAGGATTLAFSLLASASSSGSWCAAVGISDPGVLCMAELGVDLDHLALVSLADPTNGKSNLAGRWPEVTASLLEGMEAVLLLPPWPVRPQLARRLAARAKQGQTVLIVLAPRGWWPESPYVHLTVTSAKWHGVGSGHGHLDRRLVEVTATGRRAAARPVTTSLWLPARKGLPAVLEPDGSKNSKKK